MPLPPKRVVPSKFTVQQWDGGSQGEKVILYGESGMGKTTLASMAPSPVFIGIDDGGRKIKNPKTGEQLKFINGIETFADVREALQQPGLFVDHDTIVIDTITALETLALPYVFATVPTEKGAKVNSIEGYGWNKGYRHLWDTMRLILQDCDGLVRAGKNIVMIAQSKPAKVANAGGEDFLCDTPSLYAGQPSIAATFVEWADHIFAIRYNNLAVEKKKATGSERVIFTYPEPYFKAKSRTIHEPVVSFNTADDDSIWRFLFGG